MVGESAQTAAVRTSHLFMHLCTKLTNLSDMKYFGYRGQQLQTGSISWQCIELAANRDIIELVCAEVGVLV